MITTITAGNNGEGIRSDCFVRLDTAVKGIRIAINSKVKSLYGDSIEALARDILNFYGMKHAGLEITDQGALPFVLAARIEMVIRRHLESEKEYLLPFTAGRDGATARDHERTSRLYLPGNNPKLMINAGIYGCNAVILDLEDSVAPSKKQEARILVRNALRSINFCGAERMVRINQLPAGLEDLGHVVPHAVNLILIPKCDDVAQVLAVDQAISGILGHKNESIHLMPIIESAAGVMHAFEIARASENVAALAIGLEDYTADIGVQRTSEGRESFFARSMVINAAKAAGIQAIDSVFSDVDDMEALMRTAMESKAMGFNGMGCIHPRQISIIHQAFLPSPLEIEKAGKIVVAFEIAEKEGLGVVALDSKMIDPPVVKKALGIMEKAVRAGLVSNDWRKSHDK